jgi:drug/metabolite transporter (DMT)-like permease
MNIAIIKFAGQSVPPLFVALARGIIAAPVMALYVKLRGERLFRGGRYLRHSLVLGVLFGLDFVFIYWGTVFTSASRAVILMYTQPMWVALGAHFLLPGDRLTARKAAGLLLAFAGMASVFVTNPGDLGPDHWIGDLMEVAGAVLWAGSTLYMKAATGHDDMTAGGMLFDQLFYSIPVLVVAAVVIEGGDPVTVTPMVAAAVLFQALVVASGSYLLYTRMVVRHAVSKVTAFTLLTPLFGVIAGHLINGDQLTWLVLLSLSLLTAGLYLVNVSGASAGVPGGEAQSIGA